MGGFYYKAKLTFVFEQACAEEYRRPITPEVIDQDIAPMPEAAPPMSEKDRKLFAKQEKERIKREKEEEKRRKKEEEKERKRLEKEKKALLAEEKKAAKQRSKQKGSKDSRKDPDRDVRERRDSKSSNDMGREWNEARNQEDRAPATPDRTRKRLSSFEDIKGSTFRQREVDRDTDDRPPTPPAPLPVNDAAYNGRRGSHDGSYTGSSDQTDSADEHRKDAVHPPLHDDHEPEEVSF